MLGGAFSHASSLATVWLRKSSFSGLGQKSADGDVVDPAESVDGAPLLVAVRRKSARLI